MKIKYDEQSIKGLMTFLAVLAAFLPFMSFWSMSKGEGSLSERISFMFFHIKKIAVVDFNIFFVMFLNPAMFFVLYVVGLLVSFRYLKKLPVYLAICAIMQLVGCILVGFIIKDFPLISILFLATLHMLYIANKIKGEKFI